MNPVTWLIDKQRAHNAHHRQKLQANRQQAREHFDESRHQLGAARQESQKVKRSLGVGLVGLAFLAVLLPVLVVAGLSMAGLWGLPLAVLVWLAVGWLVTRGGGQITADEA